MPGMPVRPIIRQFGSKARVAEQLLSLLPQGSNQPGRSPDRPLPAIVTHGKPALIEPLIGAAPQAFLVGQHSGNAPRGLDDPLMTICAGGAIRIAEAFVATLAHGNSPDERDPNSRRVASLDQPLGTITAGGGKYGVAEPFLMPVTHGTDPGRVRSTDDPLPTITTADRGEFAVAEAFIFPVNQGDGRARGLRSVDEPAPTIVTRDSLGIAEPFIAPYYSEGSGKNGKSVDVPLDAVTTRARFGLAEPAAFLVPNFGERPGQEPRTHAIDRPLPAVTGHGAGAVAEAFVLNRHGDRASGGQRGRALDEPLPTITCSGAGYLVQRYGTDLLFRMLDNDELAAGQGFADAPRPYRFVGKKAEVTKQIGNAVPVNLSAALVRAVLKG
jgi:DNA (cytosine-5)-methyltransferase 1